MTNDNNGSDGIPRFREAVAAARDLRSTITALELLLQQGPLQHNQWSVVDHALHAMARMRDLLGHQPTRLAIDEDHDGIALVLPLLHDPQLAQSLDRLQRERPGAAVPGQRATVSPDAASAHPGTARDH
ncbi:MAG: hypothetical protein CFE44_02730 [Burkholderiales bacterium PBB4]|nr:MAG: hypothetical protein CFE44_02730 [Burkholderiales bacterium PBB4]